MTAPVKSPAACAYLSQRVMFFPHGHEGGPYCTKLRQWIVLGDRGTCVGCADFKDGGVIPAPSVPDAALVDEAAAPQEPPRAGPPPSAQVTS